MKTRTLRYAIAASILAGASFVQAQPLPTFTGHYPAGVEGIKGGTLPPPGVYLRDYNYFYYSDDLPGTQDGSDLFAYVQAPRLIWITDVKLLGGYLGVDAFAPFPYQDLKANVATPGGPATFNDDQFGIGDIFAEATLSWHGKQFDAGLGVGVWMPTGDYDANAAPSVHSGKGFWGEMLTAGGTWYFDQEKTWSLSALNRYEFNQENSDWDITPGQVWTLEWGAAKTLAKTIDVGLIGYYQVQTTSDSGAGSSRAKDHVVGIGPEVSVAFPKLTLFTSLRYAYEVDAHDRPQGHMVNLTITKRF